MPRPLLDLVTVLVLGWVGLNLVSGVRRAVRPPVRARSLQLVRGLRLRHFLPVPVVLAAVLAVYAALALVPPLRWGWWSAIGGQGNVVIGSTQQTSGTRLEWLLPLAFLALLAPALPVFVEAEERRFRLGAEGWSPARRVARGLQFGLLHLVVGIPIAAALALSVGGWWFTTVYMRAYRRRGSRLAALDESTRAHLAYDVVLLTVVAAAFAVVAVSGSVAN